MCTDDNGINNKNLLGLLAKCTDIFEIKFKPKLTASVSSKGSSLDWAFMLFLAKSMKTARAVTILAKNGYGEDAMCLARSMFENYINLAYILKENTSHRAELFFEYGKLDSLKKTENFPNNKVNNKGEIERLSKIFEEEYKSGKEKYMDGCKKHSWSCLTLKKMSEIVNAKEGYDSFYWWMSQYSHPHSEGLASYCSSGLVDDAASHRMIEEVLIISFPSLTGLLRMANEKYSLGLEKYVEEINFRYKILSDMIRTKRRNEI